MEKRDNKRKRLRLLVRAEPGSVRAFTYDVSPTGLFLVSGKVFKPGTRIRLELDDRSGQLAMAVGVVRWAKKVPPNLMRYSRGGMGIEFTWISPELQKIIDKLQR